MRAVVIGGGVAGLTSALALARRGSDVVLLESDDTPMPDRMDGRTVWKRRGVPHFLQAHSFLAGFVRVFRNRYPDVLEALVAQGAILRPVSELAPPSVRGALTDADAEISVLNARRPAVEWVLRHVLLEEPRVTVRHEHVRGVVARVRDGVPHIGGVALDDGTTIAGDVVLDASGRRSQVDRWLADVGARPASFASEPCGQIYIGRYRILLRDAELPPLNAGFAAVTAHSSYTVLMFPGDQGVLQMAIGCLPDDEAIKAARDPAIFDAVAERAPFVRDWVAVSEPVTDVTILAGLHNHLRRLVVDGSPVATGLHLVGDSACITNPQYGRGVTHAALHADAVAEILHREGDPLAEALAVDAEVERMLAPSYRDSVASDRVRTAAWRAAVTGLPPVPTDYPSREQMIAASAADPALWRIATRSSFLLDPPGGWLEDAAVRARVMATTPPPPPVAPPSRAEVLAAIGALV